MVILGLSTPGQAQSVDVEQLLGELAKPETENWQVIERQIRNAWSKSGSVSMDLLLRRGEEALAAGDYDTALEHFTALTDHAPEFAEGWNGRATAFFQKEMYGPAMQDLGRALALNPRHFGAMTGLAVVLQSVGMEPEALKVWHMIEAVHPHRPEMLDAIEALEKQLAGQTL